MQAIEKRILQSGWSEKTQTALHRLAEQSKRAAHKMVTFLQKNPHLAEGIVVGLVLAVVLQNVPLIGHLLAVLALAGAVCMGLLKELLSLLKLTP